MSDMWKAYVTIVMRGKHKGKVYSLVNNRGRRYQHVGQPHQNISRS
ncbi:hypothetical protein PR003_g8982 [Phytophthora rubi]|uniref:Uncharacterized protein n=1 Tax=Phytophthora rubi TaxID=129364 RepID=A0A6A4F9Q1_9STRA|nr:hypothetical protein PR003_g8982 [Phytophthora rubi]